jgi:hypothetical protein
VNRVTLRELAEKMGMDKSHARRYILRQGITPQKHRSAESGNQLVLTVSIEQAEHLLAGRTDKGFGFPPKAVHADSGVFYVIQLVPELDPRRIKLGFAEDVNVRLAAHRTAAPTAELIQSWPCHRSWEKTAIDCLTRADCRLIRNEVFECEDIEGLIAQGEAWFALMPFPDIKIPLSSALPHKPQGGRHE